MNRRIRHLLCLWLAAAIVLLPVSGSLLAAMSPAVDAGAPTEHLHHGHGHASDHTGDTAAAPDSTTHGPHGSFHHCQNALCGGGCAGCIGCHAPPATVTHPPVGNVILTGAQSPGNTSPPPGTLFRPPIPAA